MKGNLSFQKVDLPGGANNHSSSNPNVLYEKMDRIWININLNEMIKYKHKSRGSLECHGLPTTSKL